MEKQKEKTVTWGVGRFVIDIPESIPYRGGIYNIRFCDLVEITCDSEQAMETAWKVRLSEINELEPPKNHSKSIIDISESSKIKGVFYYGDKWMPDTGYWDILVERKTSGLWIKLSGDYENDDIENKNKMWEFASNIAKAYRPPTESTGNPKIIKGRDSFYLRYGAVDLPFEYKESAEVYFKGHTLDANLDFSIETHVIHEEKTAGLLERAAAAIASNYAPGVKTKKVRSGKRTVAGLDGEELIEIMTEDGEKMLSLSWMYLGKVDSGQYPHVIIDMNAEDTHIDQKIALWDTILDSMRPAAQ